MKRIAFSLLAFTILFTSCNLIYCPSKETFLTSYTDFVESVEAKRKKEDKDWRSSDIQFKEYADNCYQKYKDEMDLKEKKTFWAQTLKYYFNRHDGDLNAAYDDAKENLSDDFNKDLEELAKRADEDVVQLMKDLFKDDLKKGVDNVLEVLNELGEEFKKALEEKDN